MEKEYGIIMYSSKCEGKRIAYYEEIISADDYSNFVVYKDSLKENFEKTITFPLHFISLDNIDNLHSKDPFFEKVKLISDFDMFKEEIRKDLKVQYFDLAKLALQYKEYTKLYLQNIMYFIDAIYTRMYKEKFIQEDFIVYTHGPMLNSFYEKCTNIRKKPIPYLSDEEILSMYSRMIQLDGGIEALNISKQVYENYGSLSSTRIYKQGHHKLSAWSHLVDEYGLTSQAPITKEHILNYERSLCV